MEINGEDCLHLASKSILIFSLTDKPIKFGFIRGGGITVQKSEQEQNFKVKLIHCIWFSCQSSLNAKKSQT